VIGYRIILLFALLMPLSIESTCANNLENMKAGKLKSSGSHSARLGDTYSAISFYEAYLQKKPDDGKIQFDIAMLYLAARDYEKALQFFKKAYATSPEKNVLAQFYYAEMLKVFKIYDQAYDAYREFRRKAREDDKLNPYRRLAQTQMAACLDAPKILDSALVVWVMHADTSINKPSVEFSPMFLSDSVMIYASLKADSAAYVILDEDGQATNNPPVRQFYIAEKSGTAWKSKGSWNAGNFNQEGVNTGNGALSFDKKTFYFTRCGDSWKGKIICRIYRSELIDGQWQEPELLPENINLPKYTATQPAVGSDSKTGREVLYFVSDREGGRGGMDIWYSIYDKRRGQWREPSNCGSAINTPGDEITPFIDPETRSLYFSSNGHQTLGQLDIFRATGENSRWTEVQNIGYPINTPYDDFYYVIHPNREDGFFVSNRPGTNNSRNQTCCDDIFAFRYNEVIKIINKGQTYAILDDDIRNLFEDKFDTSIDLSGNIADTSGLTFAEGVVVSLFLIDKQNKELIYISADTTNSQGEYFFTLEPEKEYALEFQNYGHFNKQLKVDTRGINKSDTIINELVGINLIPKEPLIVKNVYYDFNSAKLSTDAKKNIESSIYELMKETPQIIVEISSHTDSVGSADYNIKLSQERAQSVVDFLIQKGIDKKRLYAKGYGSARPIAPNSNADGSDNVAGRERNRRTEFKIIGSLDQYSEIIYEY
jgi:OmpA-OmpF porin, OOP family